MTKKLCVAIAQLNLTVGDISGNLEKHIQAAKKARDELAADLIVFPELGFTGYPPEDLLLRPAFVAQAEEALQQFIKHVSGIYSVIGHPRQTAKGLQNACSIVYDGEIIAQYAKQHLPNYGVFDENRYFVPGSMQTVANIKGIPVGVVVCEDIWFPGPIQQTVANGARLIVTPNASPFEVMKHEQRIEMLAKRAKQNRVPIIYVNTVGGQDDIIFDGGSLAITETGEVAQCAGFFNETVTPVDIEFSSADSRITPKSISLPADEARIYQALVLGLRDYIDKNKFSGGLIGVSGGIDSALTLAIAVDALGKDRVRAVFMPSRYTAAISAEEEAAVTKNLGVKSEIISIEAAFDALLNSLAPAFAGKQADVTEENLQSRIRGTMLMALSNKSGFLVLPTGNRSEMAVGYCTLYGDTVGGYAVLKDIPKTLVYKLARYRNTISPVIPERTIERAPTAELAPNQKDEDSLPPYSVLDPILELYLNQQLGIDDICAKGFDRQLVERIITLIRRNEYKRRQFPVGARINHTAFGKDRRYPIVNGWKG